MSAVALHDANPAPLSPDAIEVFYSYSHKDEELRDELEKHLSILKRQGIITGWHDRRITAGREWEGDIDEHLDSAQIILLLISSDFLASDYCYDAEMNRAMERRESGDAWVVPIILRSCDWSGAPFAKLQALPKDAKPVTAWPNRDEVFKDIAIGIRRVVESLRARNARISADKKDRAADLAGRVGTSSSAARKPDVKAWMDIPGPRPGVRDVAFDVFLSHAHVDAEIVEALGARLEDEARFRVWLDKWVLVPGQRWQQEMARGLDQAKTCAVCIGQKTPAGWFREEVERALNRQTKDPAFRVIPVILPNGDPALIDDFLELRTWVEFKNGIDDPQAFHLLSCGINGVPPGRLSSELGEDNTQVISIVISIKEQLMNIQVLRKEKLIDDSIALEYQRKLVDQLIEPRRRR